MKLQKAQRQKVKLRIGLSSPSGYGKTYSALLLAYGITQDWSKIAVIDTENNSAQLYSHLGDFNTIDLQPPYHPDRYIQAINVCEEAGIELIIIDSITHEWDGKGGCLELVDQVTQQSNSRNSYIAWGKVTPLHQNFISSILHSSCHIITTVRRKTEYEMVKNEKGRMSAEKVGTKEITREGFEYELSLNFEIINDKHFSQPTKDRTGLFDGQDPFVIGEDSGRKLREWAIEGKPSAFDQIKQSKSIEELQKAWSNNVEYQRNPKFIQAKDIKKSELNSAPMNPEEREIFSDEVLGDGNPTK